MNTSNIPEAEILTENKSEQPITTDEDLLSRLSKRTEKKEPVSSTAPKKVTNNFWAASDDDFEKKEEPVSKTTESKDPEPKKTDNVIGDKTHKHSAENTVFLIETSTEILCKLAINKKFKNKFTDDEKDLLRNGLADATRANVKPEYLALYDKYHSLLEKRDDKYTKLPFDETEKDIMEDAWFRLYKQRNIELPPEAAVLMSTFTAIGNRVMDVVMD